jgi:cell division transport system permease protein
MLFSLGRLWQQPFASLMTATVIGIALALPAGLYVLLQNVNTVSDQWDDASKITLYLDQGIQNNHGEKLAKDIKSWPDISETHYQSSDQTLEEFRVLSGLNDLLNALPKNPLPAVIIVTPDENSVTSHTINGLLEKLEALASVDQVQLDMEWLQRLRSINKLLERGIGLLAALLSLSVLLVIGNTIRLAILSRQSEIRVMKLVGATDRFIRRPFLYTGFWYGILGGLFAWVTLIIMLYLISDPVNDLTSRYSSAFALQWFSGLLFLALPSIGTLLGISGAWLAVGRHLDQIEPD